MYCSLNVIELIRKGRLKKVSNLPKVTVSRWKSQDSKLMLLTMAFPEYVVV